MISFNDFHKQQQQLKESLSSIESIFQKVTLDQEGKAYRLRATTKQGTEIDILTDLENLLTPTFLMNLQRQAVV